MRSLLFAISVCVASPALAGGPDFRAIVENHVLPRYQDLAEETSALAAIASRDCTPDSAVLIAAYHGAFDAWIGVSHLRFGPSEENDRAFALAFWPDPRGSAPKALATMIQEEDAAVLSREDFATVSVAARGFYALEFLLFDPQFTPGGNPDYHCALVQAITRDIASNAAAILADWTGGYADLMANPGNDTYRTSTEAAQQLFTALSTGLQFTSDARLGRPMGTFERPRPNRAEVRRSGRSLRHIILSLSATQDLAALISMENANVEKAFETAMARAEDLGDPVFAGVANPQGRLRVEVLQQNIDAIRAILADNIGPSLGIAAGFNSLDGD